MTAPRRGEKEGRAAAVITLGILDDLGTLRHAFFTRQGGVSEGVFATLNAGYGSGDDPGRVAENRALAMAELGLAPEALVTAYQVHGTEVAVVDAPWAPGEGPEADGMVTRTPGIALGVLTADCAPVLLADDEAGVMGVAHAGWRGAAAGIVEAVVARMCGLGAEAGRITAAVGPCIGQRSYEVGPEFPALLRGQDPAPGPAQGGGAGDLLAPAPRRGHYLFDLAGYVVGRCRAAGIARTAGVPCDTYREEDRFFSYRRAFLRGEAQYGRCLSAIALVPG